MTAGLAALSPLIYTTGVLLHVSFKYTVGKWLFSKRKELKSAGDWAVVTGAAAGIGLAFCKELAKEGLKILLVDVNGPKLQTAAREVKEAFGVETRTLKLDICQVESFRELKDTINSLSSVACFVNNAGVFGCLPANLATSEKLTFEAIAQIVDVNVRGFTCAARAVLPKLCEAAELRKPFFINMSSITSLINLPGFSVYAASKSYVTTLVDCLRVDLRGSGVRLQTYLPSLISTDLSKVPPSKPFVPSADVFAAAALDMLGVEQNGCGYFFHDLQYWFFGLFLMLMRSHGKAREAQTQYEKKN
ncbi:unnamed protein product [Schistocephalus solidus]|uniref:Estradiol 17-beta-dehydrogenase 12 n=1 Tax=Schistocephalus solidus TaxID=70667 RepID=A0A183S9Q4_SCHSO|nr:unnamed protein product [Schistocephalus solidus]